MNGPFTAVDTIVEGREWISPSTGGNNAARRREEGRDEAEGRCADQEERFTREGTICREFQERNTLIAAK